MSAQNSTIHHIAQPYANALFDLANESNQMAEVESNLDQLAELINSDADFRNFLRSPAIPADTKREAMEAIVAKSGLPETVGNFVRLVAKNGRLFALPAMIAEFKARAAKARGEVSADVTSAAPLSEAQLNTLAETLKAKIGKTVNLVTHVDPSLIGGLVVKVGSQMIDSSLRTKLTAMKIAMKEVG